MKLSAPIHVLRTRAKALKREQNIPLSSALDQTAAREGFATWSLLMSHREDLVPTRYSELLDYVNPGYLMLVAARPGIGKTTFSMGLGAQIVRDDQRLFLFSLVERESQMWERLGACGVERSDRVLIDCSDEICSDQLLVVFGLRSVRAIWCWSTIFRGWMSGE